VILSARPLMEKKCTPMMAIAELVPLGLGIIKTCVFGLLLKSLQKSLLASTEIASVAGF
jgi:hypothetical protein